MKTDDVIALLEKFRVPKSEGAPAMRTEKVMTPTQVMREYQEIARVREELMWKVHRELVIDRILAERPRTTREEIEKEIENTVNELSKNREAVILLLIAYDVGVDVSDIEIAGVPAKIIIEAAKFIKAVTEPEPKPTVAKAAEAPVTASTIVKAIDTVVREAPIECMIECERYVFAADADRSWILIRDKKSDVRYKIAKTPMGHLWEKTMPSDAEAREMLEDLRHRWLSTLRNLSDVEHGFRPAIELREKSSLMEGETLSGEVLWVTPLHHTPLCSIPRAVLIIEDKRFDKPVEVAGFLEKAELITPDLEGKNVTITHVNPTKNGYGVLTHKSEIRVLANPGDVEGAREKTSPAQLNPPAYRLIGIEPTGVARKSWEEAAPIVKVEAAKKELRPEVELEGTEEPRLAEFSERLKKARMGFDARKGKYYRFDIRGKYELILGEEAKAFLEVLKENPSIKWEERRDAFKYRAPPAILALTARKLRMKLEKGKWMELHEVIIRQLYNAGLSTVNIDDLFGVRFPTALRWIRRYGIGRRPMEPEHKRVFDERIAAYKEGKSERIAKELGLRKPLSHLSPSERAVLRIHGEIPKVPEKMNVDVACLGFAMLADYRGTVAPREYRLGLSAGNSQDFAEKFAELANRTFGVHYVKPKYRELEKWTVCFDYKPLWEWYRKYFTFGRYDWGIKPNTMKWLGQLEPKELGRILSWYFEGDGSVGKEEGAYFSAGSVNRRGLAQIQKLVESLGIETSLGGPYVSRARSIYTLRVKGRESAKKFAELIGFVSKEKIEKMRRRIAR